jgi:hypothetical protein
MVVDVLFLITFLSGTCRDLYLRLLHPWHMISTEGVEGERPVQPRLGTAIIAGTTCHLKTPQRSTDLDKSLRHHWHRSTLRDSQSGLCSLRSSCGPSLSLPRPQARGRLPVRYDLLRDHDPSLDFRFLSFPCEIRLVAKLIRTRLCRMWAQSGSGRSVCCAWIRFVSYEKGL